MSTWGVAGRSLDMRVLAAWQESCIKEQACSDRNSPRRPGPDGHFRLPPHLAHLAATPRSTYQVLTEHTKPPTPKFLEPEPKADSPRKQHNRRKFMLDWNTTKNDHDLFPLTAAEQARLKIQRLRAHVRLERQARADVEARLEDLHARPKRTPRTPRALAGR